jgi:RNA polymerase sigma factor (sigma-70 family)
LLKLNLGNAAALAELARRYVQRVQEWCRYLGFRGQALDEAVHDGWVHAILHLNQFDRAQGTFQAWCRTVVRNMLFDLRRRQQRREAHLDRSQQDALPMLPGSEPDPAEEVVARELQEMIDRGLVQVALKRVTEGRDAKTVQAFQRRFLDEVPAEQVAAELDMPIDNVHQAYSRLRRRLEIEVNRLRDLGPERLSSRPE